MDVTLFHFHKNHWNTSLQLQNDVDLLLCFGSRNILKRPEIYVDLETTFPNATIVTASTAGEIYNTVVYDDSMVIIAIKFKSTKIRSAAVDVKDYINSYEAGADIAAKLYSPSLRYMMVISDGNIVNGSELVKGINSITRDVIVTGGLAGDGNNFAATYAGLNEMPTEGKIVCIGFYGDKLIVTHGCKSGWETFGIEKTITRSKDNILYEINNQNALTLYKKYLGVNSKDLPGAALLFPIAMTAPEADRPVVRTILSINEFDQSMTFAGDVPEGAKVRFMRANFDKLTMASYEAAKNTLIGEQKPDFSLLVSCVGRKLVLGPRIDEEIEMVRQNLGDSVPIAGFYSYGEISPFDEGGRCQLHNQTMTITSFYELS